MIYTFNFEFFIEVTVRLVLWFLFDWLDGADPFIRVIQPEEIWLYKYPNEESYVPSRDLWLILIIFPLLFLLTEHFIKQHSERDVSGAVKGLTLCLTLTGFLTCYIKILVGRPRPCFYHRCFPEGTGTDYTKCTGSPQSVSDGRKSFPSGHAALSFTCMVFMSLYIARKVNIWDRSKGAQAWKLCAIVAPILVATSIAISRTCDYHHHYEDIIAGAGLGSIVALLSYWLYFPRRTVDDEMILQEK